MRGGDRMLRVAMQLRGLIVDSKARRERPVPKFSGDLTDLPVF